MRKIKRATPVWRLAGGCIIEKVVAGPHLEGAFEQESTIEDGCYVEYEDGGASFVPKENSKTYGKLKRGETATN